MERKRVIDNSICPASQLWGFPPVARQPAEKNENSGIGSTALQVHVMNYYQVLL